MLADDYTNSQYDQLLRRVGAARYVQETYGFPCSPKTLAKLACVSSHGPPFRKVGRIPLSTQNQDWMTGRRARLDRWSGQPRKCRVLPNPILENENPAARFLGGIDVRTGRRKVEVYLAHQRSNSDGCRVRAPR